MPETHRASSVRADQIKVGDHLRLPMGRIVEVERVDSYPDGTLVIRWHEGSVYRAPDALAGQRRELGSLAPRRRHDPVQVPR